MRVLQTSLCSWVGPASLVGVRSAPPSSGVASLPRFLVFLRYQCYYEYPLLTYLEYPILIAEDIVLLLYVFHFNGNVYRAVPCIALYPSAIGESGMGLGYCFC